MPKLPNTFRKGEDTMEDWGAVPPGDYLCAIDDSDIVLTKKAQEEKNPALGQMLKLRFTILNGDYKGRKIFVQLNIINQNQTAVEIANRELNTILAAVNKVAIETSEELHNIPMMCKVGIEKDKSGNYPDKNKMLSYSPYDGEPVPAAAKAAASGASDGSKKKRPWDD
jgi:hypothetical protein